MKLTKEEKFKKINQYLAVILRMASSNGLIGLCNSSSSMYDDALRTELLRYINVTLMFGNTISHNYLFDVGTDKIYKRADFLGFFFKPYLNFDTIIEYEKEYPERTFYLFYLKKHFLDETPSAYRKEWRFFRSVIADFDVCKRYRLIKEHFVVNEHKELYYNLTEGLRG